MEYSVAIGAHNTYDQMHDIREKFYRYILYIQMEKCISTTHEYCV